MELDDFDEDEGVPKTTAPRLAPWVEKHRPESVEDVAHQDEVIRALKKSIEIGSVPHLLFHGPPGTGKTTTILALARALYGPELYKSRILELNASDERGIKVVREKIKNFAQSAVGGQKTKGYPCPRFKLIILDEADTMTPEAQSALRRVIEIYSKVTRFCLLCNYVTRVIEPLASRCAKFRFMPLPVVAMKSKILDIAQKEKVSLNDTAVDALLKASNGDMRKAVTYLQSCHQLTCNMNATITADVVIDISGKVPDAVIDSLWTAAAGYSFDAIKVAVDEVVLQGFSLAIVISQLLAQISTPDSNLPLKLTDLDRALIAQKIAEVDERLLDGASEALQLLDLVAYVSRRLHQSPLPGIDM